MIIIGCFYIFSCSQDHSDINEANEKVRVLNSKETGINFTNTLTSTPQQNIIEYLYFYNGSGVAIGDLNNDGLDDIILGSNQGLDQLYINKGNLQFEEQSFGIEEDKLNKWTTGITIGDLNNDGWNDIYLCRSNVFENEIGKSSNLVLINNKDGSYSDQTDALGLNFTGYSTQTCFLDYDKDGDLDIYLLNHAIHSVRSYGDIKNRKLVDPVSGDRLFENKINEGGGFEDVTSAANIYSSPMGYGLAITAADFDNDGWTDIYVGNDFHENDYLYLNNGDKTFTESSKEVFSYTSQFSMGVDVYDLNNDQNLDLFSTDMMPYQDDVIMKSAGEDSDQIKRIKDDLGFNIQNARNHFQLQNQDGSFSDVAYMTKTYATDWSWSVLLNDFDNNGKGDIFISNGIVNRPNDLDYINYLNEFGKDYKPEDFEKLLGSMPSQPMSNLLFFQNESLDFSTVKNAEFGPKTFSTGAAYSDFDNDGILEIIVNNINDEVLIYKAASNKYHYINIQLSPISQALNSKVIVFAGDESWIQELHTTKGFLGCSTGILHFGLGEKSAIDSIQVLWTDGQKQVLDATPIDTTLTIEKNKSFVKTNEFAIQKENLVATSILPFLHEENGYFDDNTEKLIPERLSNEGPALLTSDLDGDGYVDIFIGGGRNSTAKLLFGRKDGSFDDESEQFFLDAKFEDIDAALIDFDHDGDQDIYVVSGGNDVKELDPLLEDRIYLNNGNRVFSRIPLSLPYTNGSCVEVADYNKDGFEDIFVGARSIPGSYGLKPYSFLLKNLQGRGVDIEFKQRLGMVTDAVWADLDGDQMLDLTVSGDYMPISILLNKIDGFVNATNDYGLSETNGLWNCLEAYDIDSDGDLDLLAGNAGMNHKWYDHDSTKVQLYIGDFDNNGSSDPIVFYHSFDKVIPFASLNGLLSHAPLLKKKFTSFEAFSKVSKMEDLFPNYKENMVEYSEVNQLVSGVFINIGNTFEFQPFPFSAQRSEINDFQVLEDGKLIYVGNNKSNTSLLGPSLANSGGILSNYDSTKKGFKSEAQLPIPNALVAKELEILQDNKVIIATNQDYPYILEIK